MTSRVWKLWKRQEANGVNAMHRELAKKRYVVKRTEEGEARHKVHLQEWQERAAEQRRLAKG